MAHRTLFAAAMTAAATGLAGIAGAFAGLVVLTLVGGGVFRPFGGGPDPSSLGAVAFCGGFAALAGGVIGFAAGLSHSAWAKAVALVAALVLGTVVGLLTSIAFALFVLEILAD